MSAPNTHPLILPHRTLATHEQPLKAAGAGLNIRNGESKSGGAVEESQKGTVPSGNLISTRAGHCGRGDTRTPQ